MKCKKIRYWEVTLVIVLIVLYAIWYCPHKVTYTDIVKEATCFENGQIDTICKKCNTVLASNTLEKTAHTFGEYELTIKPSASTPGLEIRVCSVCSKEEKREFYINECINCRWSVRELQRQIASLLYERLALSKDKDKILELAQKGQVLRTGKDLVKDPFVLELGKGFIFVGSQVRITLEEEHF